MILIKIITQRYRFCNFIQWRGVIQKQAGYVNKGNISFITEISLEIFNGMRLNVGLIAYSVKLQSLVYEQQYIDVGLELHPIRQTMNK
jgi:hypothetical protein